MIERKVRKVRAEATDGAFCFLPRHADFVAALVPGLLSFEDESGREETLAVDTGVVVKTGDEVMVSTRSAIGGADLGQLRMAVEEEFTEVDEREKRARSALAKLEADFVQRFIDMQEHE